MSKEQLIIKALEMLIGQEGEAEVKESPSLGSGLIGEYVLCRSRNEGINAGYVEALDDTGVILMKVRRIWYHKPKDVNTSWYEGVAQSGLSDDSKVSGTVDKKVIIEDYSLTVCNEEAKLSIMEKEPNGQN